VINLKLVLCSLTAAHAAILLTSQAAINLPTANNAVAQTPSQNPTPNLPAKPFPVPGWLGFATVKNGTKPKFVWSPQHPSGQVIIFSDTWSKVKTGTPLIGLAPGFKQQITFIRSSEERYGCDGVPTSMAAFSATKQLPEGPVWIMPQKDAQTATALTLQELSLTQVPSSLLPKPLPSRNDVRAWKAGTATIVLHKQSQYKVKLTVAVNSQVIYSNIEEKYFFGSSGKEPVNLRLEYADPGIDRPVGAFQLQAQAAPIIVFWEPGYEGNGFGVLIPQGKTAKLVAAGSVYFCAY